MPYAHTLFAIKPSASLPSASMLHQPAILGKEGGSEEETSVEIVRLKEGNRDTADTVKAAGSRSMQCDQCMMQTTPRHATRHAMPNKDHPYVNQNAYFPKRPVRPLVVLTTAAHIHTNTCTEPTCAS